MRSWSAVGVVAMLLGTGAISGSVAAVEPDESVLAARQTGVEPSSATGSTEVASVIYAEPVLGGEGLNIEAIVFVGTGNGKHLRHVRCPLFTVERDAPRWTITAYCEARKDALGKQASLEVNAENPNANSASGCGSAVSELKRNTRFSCRVTDPHAVPEPPA